MSDDRADRIQRMREGRRGGESASTEGADAETSTDAGAADAEAEAVEGDDSPPDADLDDRIAEAVDGMDTPEGTAEVPDLDVAGDEDQSDDEDASATTDDETISVLEFVLGDERYCLDISYIEQIVERGTVTRIPNAPSFVEGVIDLRGDITTVIDPKRTLATAADDDGDLIVVFDSDSMDDDWSVGWAVDGVRRVSTVSLSAVKESPVDEPWINGVVKRDEDGEFVIWTEPGELMRDDGVARTPNA
jgi:purine-binding chemotaxis protein CheW